MDTWTTSPRVVGDVVFGEKTQKADTQIFETSGGLRPIRDAQKKGLLHMDIGTGAYSYSAVKVITRIEDEANFYKIPPNLYEKNA